MTTLDLLARLFPALSGMALLLLAGPWKRPAAADRVGEGEFPNDLPPIIRADGWRE